MLRKELILLFALALGCVAEQGKDSGSAIAGGKAQLKADISYLASDELEGRDTGTPGEALAAEYIVERFKLLGVKPAGDSDSYFQTFDFTGTPILDEANQLSAAGTALEDSLYYPINFSGSGALESTEAVDVGFGIVAAELDRDDYAGKDVKGKVALIDVSSPDGIHPHSAYLAYHDLKMRAALAEEKGAVAVLFHTTDASAQAPSTRLTENVQTIGIPAIYSKSSVEEGTSIDLKMNINRPKLQGKNVIGLLDKGKSKTLVLGAHYDHLGYGKYGSLYRGEPAIHNGADDNASGVAAMLQIALDLKEKPLEHNVLFIGFSGEERGLLGSNFFVKNPTIDMEQVNYMINMDMVGRLNRDEPKMSVNGVGTSPSWDFIDSTLVVDGLRGVSTESGSGPSDQMHFYLSDIPVLHFFSGTHSDYHKPSDDEELINYEGMMKIIAYIERVILEVDDDGELAFQQTKDEGKKAAAFKVTLGVVPDYLYEERGMRVDGVTEDRPGDNGGMKKGDIIIAMGEHKVGDIYAYMEGLAKFESGQSTTITVLREGEEVDLDITFD